MKWTNDRVELLKELWNDGRSARQIAAQLGDASRNSVIGKVHRLGLSGGGKRPAAALPRPRERRSERTKMRILRPVVRGNTALAAMHEFESEPQITENIVPIGQRCTILELGESKCRWPIGNPDAPDFFFCGGKTIAGLPYCGYHSRIAYRRTRDRRRDPRAARS
jgi:GcrA cell cycle regulator